MKKTITNVMVAGTLMALVLGLSCLWYMIGLREETAKKNVAQEIKIEKFFNSS